MSVKTVLIVEDDKEVQTLIRFVLERDGYYIKHADTGGEALELLGIEHIGPTGKFGLTPIIPDLILLDIMLPEVDGYTILSKMAQKPELCNIPVIVVTAKPMMLDLFMMSKNVKHFFAKPFNTKLLREKVKEIVG
ncbi:MAG: response regulator [Elusimicrobia bacterium]|nr:response regulator [Elusimicrobiota bacterium]MBU2614651.1 response regulator [Elusimicrobiota bacterium]